MHLTEETPLIKTDSGYLVPRTEIWIDPLEPVRTAIISHAHGDHAVPGHSKVYCTKNTALLLRARFRNFAGLIVTPEWNEVFEIDGIPFHFAPAGHMLGSAQIVWDKSGRRNVYTGDFKRQIDLTCEPFEVVKCDTFITESTFAQFEKKHPSAEQAIQIFNENFKTNYIVGAYSLGKAQRLTQLINKYCPDYRVMVHPKIMKYHRIYEQAGYDLGTWYPYQRQVYKKTTSNIYLIPPNLLISYQRNPAYLRAMASGWDRLQEGMDIKLMISDHADWRELIHTIEETGATEVYTIHGDGTPLIDHLQGASIKIREL
jgi:putative mRNA 3-end processing factor